MQIVIAIEGWHNLSLCEPVVQIIMHTSLFFADILVKINSAEERSTLLLLLLDHIIFYKWMNRLYITFVTCLLVLLVSTEDYGLFKIPL